MSSGPRFSVAATLPSAAPTQTITPAGPTTVQAPAQVGGLNSGDAALTAAPAAPTSLPVAPSSVGGFASVSTAVAAPTAPISAGPTTVSAGATVSFARGSGSVAAPTGTITPAGATTIQAPAQVGGIATGQASLSAGAAPDALPSAPASFGRFAAAAVRAPMPSGPVAVPMLMAYPPVPPQPGESTTNFGPQMTTYPTMNQSYFALANQIPNVEDWSLYPAVQNVDISGFDLLAVGDANVQSVTITTAGTCVLTSDASGDLLVNGQGLPDDAANWSNYPALQNVDISGFTLEAVGAVELTNGSGTATLTSDPSGELLVNGQPLPDDASNWSLYPALQNVDVSGFTLAKVGAAEFVLGPGVVVMTTDASGFRLYANAETIAYLSDVSSSVSSAIQTWALYPAISNLDMSGNSITDVSSLTLQTGGPSVLTSDASGNLLVNGQPVTTGSGGNAANWSFYPAISGTVDLSGSAVIGATSVSSVGNLGVTVGNDLNVSVSNDINIGGQDTSIIGTGTTQITANPKVVGAYGDVQIDAYGSVVPVLDIGFGGLVEITAHTPVATVYTLTSAVKLSGACITSYAGALTPLASLAGVNYVHGDNNVNITSGLPAIFPNLPLQTYIYGTGTPANGGIKLESSNGVEVPDGSILYIDECRPYYNPFSVGPPPDMRIGGLARLLYTQYLVMDLVKSIGFDDAATITGIKVITTSDPLAIFSAQTIGITGDTGVTATATTGSASLAATAGAVSVSGGTTATMTGGVAASMIATTGNATVTAQAGQANIGAATSASVSATTGLTLNTTGGTASLSSNAGAISVSSGTTTNISSGTTMDLSAGTTLSLTANNGLMNLTTTGANDINVFPGTSGGLHIFSQNGNPSANPEFKIENQNGNPKGAYQKFYKNSASPANGDEGGVISFHANNSNGVDTEFCEITTYAQNVAAGAEQGYLNVDIASPGLGLLTSATFLDLGVKPAAIYDGTATRGTANQVLTSTGTGILWQPIGNANSTGMTATGGTITTYYESGIRYTAHLFTTAGANTFTITSFGTNNPNPTMDMLVVGAGGSGGGPGSANARRGGGGGAGSVLYFQDMPLIPRSNVPPFSPTAGPWACSITIGAGGAAVGGGAVDVQGADGGDTSITFPSDLFRSPVQNVNLTITSGGGGGGGSGSAAGRVGRSGYTIYGDGITILNNTTTGAGGGGATGTTGNVGAGNGTQYLGGPGADVNGFTFSGGGRQGAPGTAGSAINGGAGGGGARGGGAGPGVGPITATNCGVGGAGFRTGWTGSDLRMAGGGSGAGTQQNTSFTVGPYFGGGNGFQSTGLIPATAGTLGGGGGGGYSDGVTSYVSGAGGDGVVLIRYRS